MGGFGGRGSVAGVPQSSVASMVSLLRQRDCGRGSGAHGCAKELSDAAATVPLLRSLPPMRPDDARQSSLPYSCHRCASLSLLGNALPYMGLLQVRRPKSRGSLARHGALGRGARSTALSLQESASSCKRAEVVLLQESLVLYYCTRAPRLTVVLLPHCSSTALLQ